jgi:glycosyltransferase involved in cell wall biosynthesis
MSESIFFSVIIPTFNRAQLCLRAIESVLKQTYPNFEIILVDDFSTDETPKIMQSIHDSRFRYIRLTSNSGGSSHPINQGVKISKYSYIAFLDSDDYWHNKKLEIFSKIINNDLFESGLYYSSSIIRYDGPYLPRIVSAYVSGSIYPEIKYNNIIGIASRVVVKKDIFIKAGGFDEHRYMDNDWESWIRICQLTSVKAVSDILVSYTENPDSISSNANKVAMGRQIFLRHVHSDKGLNINKNFFTFQLARLLISRGNRVEAREILLRLDNSIKKLFIVLITYIPNSILINLFSIFSYLKYIKNKLFL